jgi:hypothetical protein
MIRRLRLGRGRHASRRGAPPPTADDIGGVLWALNAPALVGLWWWGAHRSKDADAARHRPQDDPA